jgi:hypothetical protein
LARPEVHQTDSERLGAYCRDTRERAGVSLHAMARRLHRDTSTLSRFERGQQRPRDLATVLAGYEALRSVEQTQRRTQRTQQVSWSFSRPLAWLGVARWVVLAVVLTFDAGAGWPPSAVRVTNDAVRDANELRALLIFTAFMIVVLTVADAVQDIGWPSRLRLASWALFAVAASSYVIGRVGTPHINLAVAIPALAAAEVGYWACVWRPSGSRS